MPQTTDWADVQVVGIPRALLFYRFGVLWTYYSVIIEFLKS